MTKSICTLSIYASALIAIAVPNGYAQDALAYGDRISRNGAAPGGLFMAQGAVSQASRVVAMRGSLEGVDEFLVSEVGRISSQQAISWRSDERWHLTGVSRVGERLIFHSQPWNGLWSAALPIQNGHDGQLAVQPITLPESLRKSKPGGFNISAVGEQAFLAYPLVGNWCLLFATRPRGEATQFTLSQYIFGGKPEGVDSTLKAELKSAGVTITVVPELRHARFATTAANERQVYVCDPEADGILTFELVNRELRLVQAYCERPADVVHVGPVVIKGLSLVQSAACLGDGLLVAVGVDDSLSIFDRNEKTGELSLRQLYRGGDPEAARGNRAILTPGLDRPLVCAALPQRKGAFVVGLTNGNLLRFEIDLTTKMLQLKQTLRNSKEAPIGTATPHSIFFSPDSELMYVVSNESRLAVFTTNGGREP